MHVRCTKALLSRAIAVGVQAGEGPEEGRRAARGQMLLSTSPVSGGVLLQHSAPCGQSWALRRALCPRLLYAM